MLLEQCYVLYICDASTHNLACGDTNYQHNEAESLLKSWSIYSYSRHSLHFVQSTDSSLPLQQPATCSYLEQHQSSPRLHINSLRSILILPSHIHPRLPHGLFQVSPPKPCMLLSRHSFHMFRPSHSSQCYHPNNVC